MEKKYSISSRVISAQNDQKAIILNLEVGEYFGLNEVGTYLWGVLEKKPASIKELQLTMMAEYEVDMIKCEQDIRKLIDLLIDAGLIEEERNL